MVRPRGLVGRGALGAEGLSGNTPTKETEQQL